MQTIGLYAINENLNSKDEIALQARLMESSRNAYNTNFSPESTLAIYIKATEKIKQHLEQAATYCNQYNQIKAHTDEHNKNKASTLLEEFSKIIIKVQQIINEFKKVFILVPDPEHKDMYDLFYTRFSYVEERVNLFSALTNTQYVENANIMLDRIIDTFTKFLEIYVSSSNSDEEQVSYNNSGAHHDGHNAHTAEKVKTSINLQFSV